jgi:hypothetical protein
MSNLANFPRPACDAKGWSDDVPLITRRSRPNTLIVGAQARAEGILRTAWPGLAGPVSVWDCREPFLVASTVRTLIVRNLPSLADVEQRRLLKWMESCRTHVQILTVCTNPPFELVGQGLLLDKLYYRLNALSIFLPDSRTSVGVNA